MLIEPCIELGRSDREDCEHTTNKMNGFSRGGAEISQKGCEHQDKDLELNQAGKGQN